MTTMEDRQPPAPLAAASQSPTSPAAETAPDTQANVPGTDRTSGLRRRNDVLLVGGVLVYAAVVVVLMIVRGVGITPDVMAVAFGLVAVVIGRGVLFLRDWVPFIVLMLAYELMRGLAASVGFGVHVGDMVALERLISFGYVPTQVLQDWLHPATGLDVVAIGATVVYLLHFALPLFTGFVLWLWRRPQYYDFVAALILLCFAGFVTFVLFPAAPPWMAAQDGFLNGPDGRPVISYLKPGAFEQIAQALGFNGHYFYSYVFYDVSPNNVAAFPSLHAAFPFLSFLVLRRAFGRVGWLVFGYFLLASFSIVYLGDHYVVDVLAGAIYASVAYWVIRLAPSFARSAVQRFRGGRPAPAVAGPAGTTGTAWSAGSVGRIRSRRMVLLQLAVGVAVAIGGIAGVESMQSARQWGTPLYLVPWGILVVGVFVAATALRGREQAGLPERGDLPAPSSTPLLSEATTGMATTGMAAGTDSGPGLEPDRTIAGVEPNEE